MPRRNPKPQQLHRLQQQPKTCDDKKRYASEKEAVAAKEYQELQTLGLELKVYRCTVAGCGGWHLTRSL